MGKTYSEKLKDPRWQKKRLEVFERDKFKCVLCKDHESTLNVHHKKYSGDPWDAPLEDLTTLCEDCHLACEIYKDRIAEEPVNLAIKLEFNNRNSKCVVLRTEGHLMLADTERKAAIISFTIETIESLHKFSKIKGGWNG